MPFCAIQRKSFVLEVAILVRESRPNQPFPGDVRQPPGQAQPTFFRRGPTVPSPRRGVRRAFRSRESDAGEATPSTPSRGFVAGGSPIPAPCPSRSGAVGRPREASASPRLSVSPASRSLAAGIARRPMAPGSFVGVVSRVRNAPSLPSCVVSCASVNFVSR